MRRINLELSEELLEQVDEARGDVPRNRWIRRAIEAALNGHILDRVAARAPETTDGNH